MIDWQGVIGEHGTAVWRLLWRLLANRADVEECFQETMIAAWKVSQRETIDSWPAILRNLATARAMDRLRQRYREKEAVVRGDDAGGVVEAVTSAEPCPAERAVAGELAERLRAALAELPQKQAEAFCQHALAGASYRDVGRQLGMTENAVGVTIHRARQRLRELLDRPVGVGGGL